MRHWKEILRRHFLNQPFPLLMFKIEGKYENPEWLIKNIKWGYWYTLVDKENMGNFMDNTGTCILGPAGTRPFKEH